MVAARMPAMTMPARRGWNRSWDRLAKTFSAPLWVAKAGSVGRMYLPRTPMNTAAVREMTTQTVAMRRERLSSEPLRMAMNRSST